MNQQWHWSWKDVTRYKVTDCERGQSKFRLNAMLHTDIRGDEGRQNAQLNQMNNLNGLPSNLARMGSVQFYQFSPYCRMYLTPSTGCAYSCSIHPDVTCTVRWLCRQLQHTPGCTLHRPLAVSTAAAYIRMYLAPSTGCVYSCSIHPDVPYTVHWLCLQLHTIFYLCFKVFILPAFVTCK
jgi:hypothetical protein